jgi:GntR family transcriptional regulator
VASDLGLPAYLRVAAAVRDRIRRGEIAPGERMPSYRDLAESYDVAVMTAQKAVRALQDEGWVVVTPSVGAFANVPDGAEDRPDLLARVIEQLDGLEDAVSNMRTRLDHLEQLVRRSVDSPAAPAGQPDPPSSPDPH